MTGGGEHTPNRANSANSLPLFPNGKPDDSNLVDLAVLLHDELAKPEDEQRSQRAVAREFFGENGKLWKGTKSQKYVDRIRVYRGRGIINLGN